MNDDLDERVRETAKAMLYVMDRRWWQWWKPKISQQRMEQIIHEALVGEVEPIRIYGVDAPGWLIDLPEE